MQKRPILVSFWTLGLLIAAFAGGLPVDATSEEAFLGVMEKVSVPHTIPQLLHGVKVSWQNKQT